MGEKGWPRPRAEWRHKGRFREPRCPALPDRLPVPWIVDLEKLGWTGFRDEARDAARERLCAVCGRVVVGTLVLGYYDLGITPDEGRYTSGPGGHPRCMLLAATCCPRLVEEAEDDGQVAWRFDGEGAGHEVPEDDDGYGEGEIVAPEAIPLTLAELRALVRQTSKGGCPHRAHTESPS